MDCAVSRVITMRQETYAPDRRQINHARVLTMSEEIDDSEIKARAEKSYRYRVYSVSSWVPERIRRVIIKRSPVGRGGAFITEWRGRGYFLISKLDRWFIVFYLHKIRFDIARVNADL